MRGGMRGHMSDIIQRMKREECFRNYINEILRNREVDCDEEWWNHDNARKELTALAGAKGNYITDSRKMNIEGAETLILAVYKEKDDIFVKTVKEKISILSSYTKASDIQLVFFVGNMRSRIFLEKIFQRNVFCILIQEHERQEAKLESLNRFEMMQEPPISGKINLEKGDAPLQNEDNKSIRGLVCTASLLQIVELYNMLGDQLFKYNVRIGMKETLGVDSAIRNTLETEPDQFWFKNNGITILVENPDFKVNSAETLMLDDRKSGGELGFSVVNGAQTINTAAQYFYGLEDQLESCSASEREEIEWKLNRSKKARVLLRVIHIPVESETDQPSCMAKEISVALNRQKPIKIEDIAFTAPFVEKLTKYLSMDSVRENDVFQLVRRGEKTDEYRQMDLVEFSRARLACAGCPGDARNQGANELLKVRVEDGENFLANKLIFSRDFLAADETDEDRVFRRDYKAVWHAHQIASEYEKTGRGIDSTEQDIQNVIKNGKWYFTAFLIQMLNGLEEYDKNAYSGKSGEDKLPDFSNFACNLKEVLEPIPQAIKCFANIVVTFIKKTEKNEKYGEPDSNLFKKNDLYKDIIREIKEKRKLTKKELSRQPALVQCMEFAKLFQLEIFEESPVGESEAETDEKRTLAGKFVILGSGKYTVQSDAHAIAMVTEYILTYYPPVKEALKEMDGWITDDKRVSQEGQGYFSGTPKLVDVNGKNYWIGTHSNTKIKCRQMKRLCELASVPQGCIFWYKEVRDKPQFSW